MRRLAIGLLASFAVISTAAAFEPEDSIHVTPPLIPHPYPQGVPVNLQTQPAQPVVTLRYGIVDGRRALIDPWSGAVVYFLHP